MTELTALFDQLAADLDGVERRSVAGGVEYLRAGEPFAILGSAVEFRLRPDITSAALRTPDTAASSRGPEWIAFEPRVVDRFARDRATAWFTSAWGWTGSRPG